MTMTYRDHVALRHRAPANNPRTTKLPGHRVLDNASRPAWTYGEPDEARLPMLPDMGEGHAADRGEPMLPWPWIVAGIFVAVALIQAAHMLFGVPGIGVLFGARS